MSSTTLAALVARCRALCRPRSHAADSELLSRYAQERDTASFEELLERYAPLVWGSCRRIAPTEADAEDAFQATFLALVRQADRLDGRQPLAGWLHTVAVRVARKAGIRARKEAIQIHSPEPVTPGDISDEVSQKELFRMVDEEIEQLPATLRLPLILCCLQGGTRDEAAQTLRCSVAAVKSRLERGRDLLRRRLQRRGVQLPAAFLLLGLTTERIRAELWVKTMQSALCTPAPAITALAGAGISTVSISKSRLFLIALLFVSSAAVAGTLLTEKPEETPPLPQEKAVSIVPKQPEIPQVRRDRHGDPLPEGAIARLGTVRWRHGLYVHNLAYSADGKKIAAVGLGRAITLWDADTGKEVCRFPDHAYSDAAAFSPDGKILATTGGPICHLWDAATGKELRQLQGHTKTVRGIAFAPDGKTLATVSQDETARLWDAKDGKEIHRFDCKQGFLRAVAYSPDGRFLATAGQDGTIRLWNPSTGLVDRQLNGHKKEVWKITFSQDSTRLASSGADGTIGLWDILTARQNRLLGENLGQYNLPIAFSPDGTFLAAGVGGGLIRLWDPANGEEKRQWRAGAMDVRAVAWSPDGKTLATGAAWEGIRLWDVATGNERHPSQEHLGVVDFVRFSPDGASLVSISRERRLVEWDLTKQTPRRHFTWGDKGVGISRTALSPDGNTLAVGSWADSPYTQKVCLWDLRTGKPSGQLGQPQPRFSSLAFSPDGRLLASVGSDQAIHIWDVRESVEARRIQRVANGVARLSFSPDSKAVVYSSDSDTVSRPSILRLCDVDTGKERRRFDCPVPAVFVFAFSPDGKVLATGDAECPDDPLVRLWETATGKELSCHKGHRGDIAAVAFSPDGKLVASGTGSNNPRFRDNSIHVWEAATGRLIRRFEGQHSCISSVAFSPDGLTLASGAGDSTILIWDITGRRADCRWHVKPLMPRALESCWSALANDDATKAYDAVWSLVAAPDQAVPFLQKHLQPVARPDAKAIARLIADLDNDDFLVRQKATDELARVGGAITLQLRRTLENKPSLEVRGRVQQVLDQTRDWTVGHLRDHRAIQALEHIGTYQAKELLQNLAAGSPGALRTEEANAALLRLAK
ncbi:MAG TPA: sigma-70 family RNA polymerase sigma factor [Gemmataceae bacterium]|jgi:RNA polymerase sigma factor (sigma-70 family)